jgi:hypothetical protein
MVSDTYTVRYLLQGTRDVPARVAWREHRGGLMAEVDGVEVLMTEIATRLATRLGLRFRCGSDEFWLYSPVPLGWSRREYGSEEERDLAELLPALWRAAREQCARKRNFEAEHREEIRDRVYRQLLWGPAT